MKSQVTATHFQHTFLHPVLLHDSPQPVQPPFPQPSHTLQVHLLPVPEWVTTLGAPGTRRVEVVVIACLQHLPADEAVAVGTFHPKLGLVVLLAVGETIPGDTVVAGVRHEDWGNNSMHDTPTE